MHHGVVRIGRSFGYIAPYYAPRVHGIYHTKNSVEDDFEKQGISNLVDYQLAILEILTCLPSCKSGIALACVPPNYMHII
jgi:hypothetical protein